MIKADSFIASDGQTIRLWRWPHQEGRNTLFWAHATGFHGRLYQPLLNQLSDKFNVVAWDMRGHGESDETDELHQFRNWDTYYHDLGRFLELEDKPVYLAGHSVGGMTALAAATLYPKHVKGVFLIEPVIFDRRLGWSFAIAKILGKGHKMPLAAGAARRRKYFDNKQQAFDNFRSKKAFRSWPDEWLSLYVEYGLKPKGGRFTLSCRPEWESRSFAVSEHRPQRFLRSFPSSIPVYVLVGERDSTFFTGARPTMRRHVPHASIQTVPDSSHFLPMEHPEIIKDWLLDNIRQ